MYGVKPFFRFLLLKQLVSHGKEGDGEPGAKEDDEVGSKLVPRLGENVKMLTIFRNINLLLMENGRLSPGAGSPSPPRLSKNLNKFYT